LLHNVTFVAGSIHSGSISNRDTAQKTAKSAGQHRQHAVIVLTAFLSNFFNGREITTLLEVSDRQRQELLAGGTLYFVKQNRQ